MRPFAALAALALTAAPLAAQTPAPAPTPRFGILAGLNSATLTAEDLLEEPGTGIDRRNGFAGGVYLTLPVGASGLSFRPELLYAQRGATASTSFTDEGSTFELDAAFALSYLELPLLLQYAVPTAGGLRPQLYAGVAPALRTSCRLRVRASFAGESESQTTNCDDADEITEESPDVRRFDVGGVAGGALAFDVGGRALTVGARYTHGFLRLATDGESPRNRAVAVYGSLEFSAARRVR